MAKKKTTIITRDTQELVIVRWSHGGTIRAWCQGCVQEVEMISPEDAARVSGATALAVYRRAEAGEIHFLQTEEGPLLICPTLLV